MSATVQPVTGNEAFWGDLKPTQSQLDLINKSPTFQQQIHDANARVNSGDSQPITINSEMPDAAGGHYNYETGGIEFPPGTAEQPDQSYLGTLSHELGHGVYEPNDIAFAQKYIAGVNPRDPGLYHNVGMFSTQNETEGEYNNWKIGGEIEKNTASGGQPGTQIDGYLNSPITETIQNADAARPAGLTDAQNDNRLIHAGMGASLTHDTHFTDGTYNYDAHRVTGGAPIEPGRPVSASVQGDNNTGDLTSTTEHWGSGDVSTQNYQNGKLQNTQTVDASGKPLQSAAYHYDPDGSYGLNVKDGTGHTIQQSDFNADGSGTERGYNADGSRLETQFNGQNRTTQMTQYDGQNRTTQMTQYDGQNRETQKDYFDPNEARNTNQVVTRPDGSRTLYSFNDQNKVGSEVDYDANGNRTSMNAYDPDTGRVTFNTRYGADGSRTVDTVGADGSGTRFTVDKDGTRSPDQAVTYNAADRSAFDAESKTAGAIAPPQPVGAGNALGGQRNYYDPATNRLTNQTVTNADGSKTLSSYNDENTLGARVDYDANGKRTSAQYFDPVSESLNKRVDYSGDGSRSVTTPDMASHSVNVKQYDPDNRLTQTQTMGPEGSQTTHYDPETGVATNQNTANPDGTQTIDGRDAQGNVRVQSQYDANGKPTSSVAYDPGQGTGTLTHVTYNADGGRTVDKAEGSQFTTYNVDSNGQQTNPQTSPLSDTNAQTLSQWKSYESQTPSQGQGGGTSGTGGTAPAESAAANGANANTDASAGATGANSGSDATSAASTSNASGGDTAAASTAGNQTAQQTAQTTPPADSTNASSQQTDNASASDAANTDDSAQQQIGTAANDDSASNNAAASSDSGASASDTSAS